MNLGQARACTSEAKQTTQSKAGKRRRFGPYEGYGKAPMFLPTIIVLMINHKAQRNFNSTSTSVDMYHHKETRRARAGRCKGDLSYRSGSVTVKLLPQSGALSILMEPPAVSRIRFTRANPKPLPSSLWELSA
ncbi:hypothetical protein SDC9_130638 [bioreactor metagenome]|uniref:Uncharacterized protein n=1 Tax=bioreactor metagenome TaxID=1076179 RepID=A0A645D2Q7_9ZZZZ